MKNKKIVLRITRHGVDAARLGSLKETFGDDVKIVEKDLEYGIDPVKTVAECIASIEGRVIAVEAIAPFPVLTRLVDSGRTLGIKLIRAELKRGEDGRALVLGQDENGRDLLAFDRYVELVRLTIETRELT